MWGGRKEKKMEVVSAGGGVEEAAQKSSRHPNLNSTQYKITHNGEHNTFQ